MQSHTSRVEDLYSANMLFRKLMIFIEFCSSIALYWYSFMRNIERDSCCILSLWKVWVFIHWESGSACVDQNRRPRKSRPYAGRWCKGGVKVSKHFYMYVSSFIVIFIWLDIHFTGKKAQYLIWVIYTPHQLTLLVWVNCCW